MSKIFFDANVLLDILIPNRPNHERAVEVYTKVCDEYEVLASTENILTTIEYIATRNGTPCEVVWQFFDGLSKNFELYNFSEILSESLEIYHRACRDKEKIDFEDLLQIQSAIRNGCQVFLTEDRAIARLDLEIEVMSLTDF